MKQTLTIFLLTGIFLSIPVLADMPDRIISPAPIVLPGKEKKEIKPPQTEEEETAKPEQDEEPPTPAPSVQELVYSSDCIVRVNFQIMERKEILNMIHIEASGAIQEVYKQKEEMGKQIELYFFTMALADSKWLQSPPSNAEYILFLKHKPVIGLDGKETTVISLREPHSFSFREVTPELSREIKNLTGREL